MFNLRYPTETQNAISEEARREKDALAELGLSVLKAIDGR